MECVRVIQASPGFDMLVHFHHLFEIESSYTAAPKTAASAVTSDCPNDFVALNFTGSLECIWLLEVPHDYSIVLYINEFSLYAPNHCDLNFLEVYSGTTSDRPLKRYCGMTAAHVFSSHYLMYIRFYLHDANQIRNTSISALYSSFVRMKNCSSKQLLTCGDENCVPQQLACNGRVNCPYGTDEMNCHVGELHMTLLQSGAKGQHSKALISAHSRHVQP
ncbi:unnamed protein product [Haemonchus placei]|uniref:CUB domain-containing protein n=1 Tax=Haemonchus placei TaxID=6290 RepID=A0A158QKT2_HAEPC|nr:unnamed protein product [Haemonchus placei]